MILDAFTELQAELQARQKQYEHYRERLLSFDELVSRSGGGLVKMMSLGEVGEFVRGNGLQKKDFVEFGVPCIHYGQIYTYYGTFTHQTKSFVSEAVAKKLKKAQSGNLIIAGVSENKEYVCKTVVYLGSDEIKTTKFRNFAREKGFIEAYNELLRIENILSVFD